MNLLKMVKELKLKQAFIFSSSFFHLPFPKWDHKFTSLQNRVLNDSLAPRPINLASWNSVHETPREHNNDVWIIYVSILPIVLKLFQLFQLLIPKYPKFLNPFQNFHKISLRKELPSSNLKSPIYNP